ncbi:MAG TPA: arginine N-succinyltransferase [Desulfomonilaceae bacterium]|nr:arginine N-succinyltransferase [Desulfomonilaceae bacterium]
MVVVRPVKLKDLDGLVQLAYQASFGLTSLPRGRELLHKRILESTENFARTGERPRGELFVFVMEDLEHGLVVGTSSIVSKLGGFQPFYAYRIETCLHESQMLNVRKQVQTLHLVVEHSGPSEIGGLFLAPEYQKHGRGRLLSLFRFLFMSEQRSRFESPVLAEMRGVVDDQGRSPFWEAIGRHFFDIDYPTADYLTQVDKKFIADLMPTCPIYIPLLPKSAQDVIGKVHERTEPALKLLVDEGFRFSGMVDIFEAGPIIQCNLDEIRIVKESQAGAVTEIASAGIESDRFIICSSQKDFRACVGTVDRINGGVRITRETAALLQVTLGDRVRFGPFRPSKTSDEGK